MARERVSTGCIETAPNNSGGRGKPEGTGLSSDNVEYLLSLGLPRFMETTGSESLTSTHLILLMIVFCGLLPPLCIF